MVQAATHRVARGIAITWLVSGFRDKGPVAGVAIARHYGSHSRRTKNVKY